jgi:uncharacterized membrane protein YsdA (DUF1294 family)/cold shock CspA family protein
MQLQGKIEQWQAQRGFGFIRSGGTQYFFHIRDFRGAGAIPVLHMDVRFEAIQVGGKGPRAMAVEPLLAPAQRTTERPLTPRAPSSAPSRKTASTRPPVKAKTPGAPGAPNIANHWFYVGLPLFVLWLGVILAGLFFTRTLPGWLPLGLILLNLATFYAYWLDKHAARRGAWRTKESTLHTLSLVGGWPGAWWAQQLLRHKSSKQEFRQMYWATVMFNLAGLGFWVFGARLA